MSAADIDKLVSALVGTFHEDANIGFVCKDSEWSVRALLTALREPTLGMWTRMYSAAWAHEYECVQQGSFEDRAALSPEAPGLIWQAMIDTLLGET